MDTLDTDTTIAQIVTDRPATAAVFERLGIDFCCGGERSLADAAGAAGLDAQTLLRTIDAVDAAQGASGGAHQVADLGTPELIDHIVGEHHATLRRQLPMIGELLETVVRVHGAEDPSLAPLCDRFAALAAELDEHIELEESSLFPACRAAGDGAPLAAELIEQLRHDHDAAGAALVELRELGGGYDTEAARCNTHRFLLTQLAEFEQDLHLHVHEENNILFPRVLAAAGA
jgi:regulator of cell morphogenesis and NO signaling